LYGVFEYQFLKVVNQFLETQITNYSLFNLLITKGRGGSIRYK
jgi:hypothetical protein